MATEKFIHGKHDDGKHDGLYSNTKRVQQADFHLKHWQEEIEELPNTPPLSPIIEGVPHIIFQARKKLSSE